MEPFVLENEQILKIEDWIHRFPNLEAGMTTKNGGFSQGDFQTLNMGFHVGDQVEIVCTNRTQVANQINFPLKHWVGAEQTHGINIKKVSSADCGKGAAFYDSSFKDTDGFYTNEKGILLTLNFADCVPLFFIAPQHEMIGIAHAGWKGTVNRIASQMVESWGREGITPQEIFAVIGPSICDDCYVVDRHVMNFVENILEDTGELPYNLINEGQYKLNLKRLNRLILTKSGVPEANIMISKFCSSCNQFFFSHRRDNGKTGRMLGFIGWKETAKIYGSTHKF